MPPEVWFVHIQGETFGPVSSEVIHIMLKQNRLQFSDFVWTEGLTKWMRINDLHQFAAYLPPYPVTPIPSQMTASPTALMDRAESSYNARPVAPPAAVASGAAAPAPAKAPAPAVFQTTPTVTSTATGHRPAPRAESPLKAWIRRYGRVRILASVAIENHGTFETVDISEGGIFLKSPTPIPFGTDLKFKLESGEFAKVLEMTGIVIREGASEDGQYGFAIQFTRVNPAHRRVIHEYVKAQLKAIE